MDLADQTPEEQQEFSRWTLAVNVLMAREGWRRYRSEKDAPSFVIMTNVPQPEDSVPKRPILEPASLVAEQPLPRQEEDDEDYDDLPPLEEVPLVPLCDEDYDDLPPGRDQEPTGAGPDPDH